MIKNCVGKYTRGIGTATTHEQSIRPRNWCSRADFLFSYKSQFPQKADAVRWRFNTISGNSVRNKYTELSAILLLKNYKIRIFSLLW